MIISDPDFATQVPFSWHLGACYSKPGDTEGLTYVHIPKNASSFTRDKVTNAGFELGNYHNERKYRNPVIAILRDPVDRWISGALEYLVKQFPDPAVTLNNEKFVFTKFEYDEHTARQTKFLHGLDTDNITFFRCDVNYKNNLFEFFKNSHSIVLDSKYSWRNATHESPVKRELKPLLIEKINQGYRDSLNEYLQPDYKLIESVKFYDTTQH